MAFFFKLKLAPFPLINVSILRDLEDCQIQTGNGPNKNFFSFYIPLQECYMRLLFNSDLIVIEEKRILDFWVPKILSMPNVACTPLSLRFAVCGMIQTVVSHSATTLQWIFDETTPLLLIIIFHISLHTPIIYLFWKSNLIYGIVGGDIRIGDHSIETSNPSINK